MSTLHFQVKFWHPALIFGLLSKSKQLWQHDEHENPYCWLKYTSPPACLNHLLHSWLCPPSNFVLNFFCALSSFVANAVFFCPTCPCSFHFRSPLHFHYLTSPSFLCLCCKPVLIEDDGGEGGHKEDGKKISSLYNQSHSQFVLVVGGNIFWLESSWALQLDITSLGLQSVSAYKKCAEKCSVPMSS